MTAQRFLIRKKTLFGYTYLKELFNGGYIWLLRGNASLFEYYEAERLAALFEAEIIDCVES
jgi:hypothetical protein